MNVVVVANLLGCLVQCVSFLEQWISAAKLFTQFTSQSHMALSLGLTYLLDECGDASLIFSSTNPWSGTKQIQFHQLFEHLQNTTIFSTTLNI